MNINKTSQVNFGANFINNVQIEKNDNKTGKYMPLDASFVEFCPSNKNDLKVIEKTAKWERQVFASGVVDYARMIVAKEIPARVNHIYMLTTQKDNFDNLKFENILGVAHVQAGLPNEIPDLKFLQAKPITKYGEHNRQYREVGARIIDSLKKIYDSITLLASYQAANFYEKQGFKITTPDLLEYLWKRKG